MHDEKMQILKQKIQVHFMYILFYVHVFYVHFYDVKKTLCFS